VGLDSHPLFFYVGSTSHRVLVERPISRPRDWPERRNPPDTKLLWYPRRQEVKPVGSDLDLLPAPRAQV
jgi:hypothetical protein